MKLAKDARIFNADGKEIGNLNRFVLDPRTRNVTHLVFESGLFSTREYVLPITLIDRVEDDHIVLKELTIELDELPAFEEEHYVVTNEHALIDGTYVNAEPGTTGYYYYPPAFSPNTAGLIPDSTLRSFDRPNVGTAAPGPVSLSGQDQRAYRKEIEQNIPEETVALKEGAKVISSDSKQVGSVEKLFLNDKNNVTHMLITKGLLLKERKVVPTDWIANIYESEVHLAVESSLLESLPDFKEQS